MVPSAARFSSELRSLGVGSGDHLVCYDGKGIFSAARLWWMARAFGHASVSVLDGGLPEWTRCGLSIENGGASGIHIPADSTSYCTSTSTSTSTYTSTSTSAAIGRGLSCSRIPLGLGLPPPVVPAETFAAELQPGAVLSVDDVSALLDTPKVVAHRV